jgi:hypothetical protein
MLERTQFIHPTFLTMVLTSRQDVPALMNSLVVHMILYRIKQSGVSLRKNFMVDSSDSLHVPRHANLKFSTRVAPRISSVFLQLIVNKSQRIK